MLRSVIGPPLREGDVDSAPGDRHFAQVIEASAAFIWLLDMQGRLAVVNGPARRLFANAPSPPDHLWRSTWPEGSRFSIDRAVASARDGESFQFRTRYSIGVGPGLYLDATASPVRNDAGNIIRILIVAHDVTTQVESAAFLNTVIDVLPVALAVKDVRTRRIVLANRAAEDLFDRPEGMVGLRVEDALSPDLADWALGDDVDVTDPSLAIRQDSRAGGVRFLSTAKIATYDDEGPRHLISMTENVTQRHRDGEALRNALDKAEQASRVKTAFLTNITHEIRTPLNGVVAGIDLLAARHADGADGELIDLIRTSAAALERRLEDLLAVSRLTAWDARLREDPVDVADLLDALVQGVKPRADAADLEIATVVEPGMERVVLGDRGCLQQALERLIDNAVKFTERGGVTMTVGRRPDGQVRFSFADTGIGFDPVLKDQLFAGFQQQDPSLTRRFGGMGLGLTAALHLARLMGGAIDAESIPGTGTTVWMDLPLAPVPVPADPGLQKPDEGATRRLQVLVADDHPTNRRIVELMLADVADVVSVDDGQAALQMMATRPFDVVLMDIQMPVMDGITAVARIRADEARAAGARTPIIMLTANTQDEYVIGSRQAGADRLIGKPFTAMVLMNAIQSVLPG